MKIRILSFAFTAFALCLSANASDKLHVSAEDEFKTEVPAETIDVNIIGDSSLGSISLKNGDILHCNILSVKGPRRGKRSATFTVCPIYYISESETKEIDTKFSGKYSKHTISKDEIKNIDKKAVGKKAVLTVGNHFIKGVAPAASLAEGMIKNEDGHIIKSGIKQVYKDSFLSYIEKGEHITIEKGDEFYLTFKPVKIKKKKSKNKEVSENNNINESYK